MADPTGKGLLVLLPAPGATPEEAAQAVAKQLSLQPAESRRTIINGFPALVFTADQVQQDPQTGQQVAGVRVLSYIIHDGKSLYAFMGVAAPADFPVFAPQFAGVAENFARLSEPDKLNRKPERVHIQKLKLRSNLRQALLANGTPESRLEELAILNGMPLNEQVNAGSLIKVVSR